MTENDYIAEYVREKHPSILGFDFCMWLTLKKLSNSINAFADAIHNLSVSDTKKGEDDGN